MLSMKVTKTANFDSVINDFIQQATALSKLESATNKILETLANEMIAAMKTKIAAANPAWTSKIGMDVNKIEIIGRTENTITVACGSGMFVDIKARVSQKSSAPKKEETAPTVMPKEKKKRILSERQFQIIEAQRTIVAQVNPFFFLEYGFGLAGQKSPHESAPEIGWAYNINNHPEIVGDYDWKRMGTYWKVDGAIGVNFLESTINEYSSQWVTKAQEILRANKIIT